MAVSASAFAAADPALTRSVENGLEEVESRLREVVGAVAARGMVGAR